MSSPIRVGLIRCDSHGMWFGPLMMRHDPLLLQRPMDPDAPKDYSWQLGMNHRYFYANAYQPKKMTAPFIEGFEIVKLWDEHRAAAEMARRVYLDRQVVCDAFEEVSDDVDLVLIADCNYDGSDHLTLARPGLEKGVATFVDKPLADSLVNAEAILELGRKHGAPVLSLSMLRVDPVVAQLKGRIAEIGSLNLVSISGCGTHPAGLVHTVSAAQHLCGAGIKTVTALVSGEQTVIHLGYGSREDRPKQGAVIHCDAGRREGSPMAISLLGTLNDLHVRHPGDVVFPFAAAEVVKLMREMVRTRAAPAGLMREVVESIAVVEAAHRAMRTGRTFEVAG